MGDRYAGKIEKIDDYRWRLPRDAAAGMRVIGAVTARGPGLNCSHPR